MKLSILLSLLSFSLVFSFGLFAAVFLNIPSHLESSHLRPRQPNAGLKNNAKSPVVDRLIFFVLDAFRTSFIFEYEHCLQSIRNHAGLVFNVKTFTPTVTSPRLKTLTSGTVPEFSDVFFNMDSSLLQGDTLVHQWNKSSMAIAFYGDDTWLKLFPSEVFLRHKEVSSFYAVDFTDVDNAVTDPLFNVELHKDDWSILILHYLGLDHIGHSRGPDPKLVCDKLNEMDEIFSRIYDEFVSKSPNNMLVVMGDHGMSNEGSHGGATEEELYTPLLLVSDLVKNERKPTSKWDLPDITQVDIATSVALATGISIPESSLGVIPIEMLTSLFVTDSLEIARENYEHLLNLCTDCGPYNDVSQDMLSLYKEMYRLQSILLSRHSTVEIPLLVFLVLLISTCIIPMISLSSQLYDRQRSVIYFRNFTNAFIFSVLSAITTIGVFSLWNSTAPLLKSYIFISLFFLSVIISSFCVFAVPVNLEIVLYVFPFFVFHAFVLFSSSLIEEEQYFWYFSSQIILFLYQYYMIRKSHKSDECLASTSYTLLAMIIIRFFKAYVYSGVKWAADGLDYARIYRNHDQTLNFCVSTALVAISLACHLRIGKSFLFVCFLANSINIYAFKVVRGDLAQIFPFFDSSTATDSVSATPFAQFSYLILIVSVIIISSMNCNEKSVLLIHFLFQLGQLLLRSHLAIVLALLVILSLCLRRMFTNSNTENDSIFHLLILVSTSRMAFHALENSNRLSTIDVGAAYIGLSEHHPVFAGTLVILATSMGPLFPFIALKSSESQTAFMSWSLVLYQSFVVVVCSTCITALANHLFVWSVFAPKMLYEFYWTILIMLLPYEIDLVREIAHQSCLTILGNGLGAHDLVVELCKLYAEANLFVLVLNASLEEQKMCYEKLKKKEETGDNEPAAKKPKRNEQLIHSRIRYLNYQFGTPIDRKRAYAQGGVFFMATAPMLILDIINEVLPCNFVSGILIPSAHQMVSSQDANDSAPISLAIRLLLEQNPGVFVTALTDRPGAISSDSGSGLSRLCSALMVDRILLRPRYEATVKRSFKATEEEESAFRITQIDVPLTENMKTCHSTLLQLCAICSRELRTSLGSVSCLQRPDTTVSNAQMANSQLPVINTSTRKASMEAEMEAIRLAKDVGKGGTWSLLPQKARNLAEDVIILRGLVASLLRDSPFKFHSKVMAITGDPQRRVSAGSSGWIAHSETILLEKTSKERAGLSGDGIVEHLPLWESFVNVFTEASLEMENEDTLFMVVGSDDSQTNQLTSVLSYGIEQHLDAERQRYFDNLEKIQQNKSSKFGKNKGFRRKKGIEMVPVEEDSNREVMWLRMNSPYLSRLEQLDKFFDPSGPFGNRPNRVIILCANSLTLMRQIEKFCTTSNYNFHVYWLSHRGTLEERDYLSSLSAEAAAFTRLTSDRSSLAVSRDLLLQNAKALKEERSEEDGGSKVLIDIRELRSQLPGAVHMRGLTMVPRTLLVADYILTPDCGIERKALPDLIGSIFSGRLYTQCTALTATFSKPILLIELPTASMSTFSSSSHWNVVLPRHTALAEIRSSLVLLVLRFPKLRLVWSPSPDASALLFIQLKRGQPDPPLDSANSTITDFDEDSGGLLRSFEHLPGLSSIQAKSLSKHVTSLRDLAQRCKNGTLTAPGGEVVGKIGANSAKQLSDFLNMDLSQAAITAATTASSTNNQS